MQTTFALAALASVAFALPQAATPNPAGCQSSYDGDFQITILNGSSVVTKRDIAARATCGQEGLLTAKLADGVLTDSQGRIGNIVSNNQFQFDPAPGQTGALLTKGWSACSNGSLAIAGSTLFYSCKSGDFANLYDKSVAEYCLPVYINILPCGASSGGAVSQKADGQPTATNSVAPVTQITDGQAQAPTAVAPVTQIGDGQLQGPSAVSQIPDGQLQIPTGIPVTQIGDGQLQAHPTQAPAPAGKPVTQIGDGQVQAPTTAAAGKPVTQIGDGQVQAPTSAAAGAPVTQIGDGQVQAPTTAAPKPSGAPVTQIGDGQIQANPTAPATPVSQIPDGQLRSNVSVSATPSVVAVSAGNGLMASTMATVVVGLAAVLLL